VEDKLNYRCNCGGWHAWMAGGPRQFKQRLRHLRQKTAAFEDFGIPS